MLPEVERPSGAPVVAPPNQGEPVLAGEQAIIHEGTIFHIPGKIAELPEVENHVPLPPLPKIRRHSTPGSVLAFEGDMLWLKLLYLQCRGSPPPWQNVMPEPLLTEAGWGWIYRVRLPLRETGFAIGFTETHTAVFAFKGGKLLAFQQGEMSDPGEVSRLLS